MPTHEERLCWGLGDEVLSYHITSMHYDNGTGDSSYLYDFAVWVR